MSTWTRFLRFNAVSALGIGVQLAALWLLTAAGVDYLAATTLAVTAAVVHNFFWHRRWTWADRQVGVARSFVAFATANGAISLATNLVVMAALVGGVGMAPVVANLLAIGCAGVLNFWLGDTVVFAEPVRSHWPAPAPSAPVVAAGTRPHPQSMTQVPP